MAQRDDQDTPAFRKEVARQRQADRTPLGPDALAQEQRRRRDAVDMPGLKGIERMAISVGATNNSADVRTRPGYRPDDERTAAQRDVHLPAEPPSKHKTLRSIRKFTDTQK